MARTADGAECGFDWELIGWIAKQLKRPIQKKEFATVPELLLAARDGEVDVAIGSLTRTRAREHEGNAFTTGYLNSPPVLACKSSDPICPADFRGAIRILDGDEVGVIASTTNESAAIDLQKHLNFIKKNVGTFQSLIKALDSGGVHFILIDRPFVESRCMASGAGSLQCLSIPDKYLATYKKSVGRQQAEEYALAVDNAALRSQINKQIALAREEILPELQRKYLSELNPCFRPTTAPRNIGKQAGAQ